ncbi:unnamed protein product [Calicophoron daubneyi]|uniref:Ig-like domain-containing protein n=1 Tax=Calicophoron daubneyi TaxID=300641 RepID=A0AAV2SZU7_CALDB
MQNALIGQQRKPDDADGEHDETGFILLKNDRPVDQNVLEGEPVRLHCVAEKAVNYVIWYYQRFSLFTDESKTYGEDSEATLNLDHEVTELAVCQPGISCKEKHSIPDLKIHHTGVLSIARAEMRHSGKYGCTIVEGINTKTAYILLTVNVHPSIPVIKRKSPSDTLVNTTKEGDLLILTCSSVRSYPLAKLTWLKITEGKSEPEQIIPSSLVSFRQMEQTDTRPAGILVTSEVRLTLSWLDHLKHIMCKAKNRVGSAFSEPFPIHVDCEY